MQILNDKVLNRTKFLEFRERIYTDKNGDEKSWYFASRTGGKKAVVIVATYEDIDETRLVVTREFRVPIRDYEWGFPAGMMDDGESTKDTVTRELKEETGLDIDEILKISPFVFNSAGLTDECLSMVYVKAKGVPNSKLTESSEDIQTFLLNMEEVNKLLKKDVKFGAKAWIVMERFAREGKI